MSSILVALHAALALTLVLPVYGSKDWEWSMTWADPGMVGNRGHFIYSTSPLEEGINAISSHLYRYDFLASVVAAGLPGGLALLNLPLILSIRRPNGNRWRAYSSMILGLLSTLLLAQLLTRYGDGRTYGGWVIWGVSVLLTIAGTAAVARLKAATAPLLAIRSS
jgi:hypothetical protein